MVYWTENLPFYFLVFFPCCLAAKVIISILLKSSSNWAPSVLDFLQNSISRLKNRSNLQRLQLVCAHSPFFDSFAQKKNTTWLRTKICKNYAKIVEGRPSAIIYTHFWWYLLTSFSIGEMFTFLFFINNLLETIEYLDIAKVEHFCVIWLQKLLFLFYWKILRIKHHMQGHNWKKISGGSNFF